MSVPAPQLYDSTGTSLVDRLTFDPVLNGTPSAWQTIQVWNARGNAFAGEMRTASLGALSRDSGSTGGYTATHRAAAEAWVEAYFTGVVGGTAVAQETAIRKIGATRRLFFNVIPADSYRELKVRVNPPPGSGVQHIEVNLEVYFQEPSMPLSMGFAEAGLDGVLLQIGDTDGNYLARGGEVTATGTPDADVHVAPRVVVVGGVPHTVLAETVTTNGNDSAAAALAAGEAYWITLTDDGTSTANQVKSVKGTAPLGISTRPAVPAGEVLIAYIHRDFDAAIATGDIYGNSAVSQQSLVKGLYSFSSSGLTGYLGSGVQLIDNCRVGHDYESSVTLAASTAGQKIWAVYNGSWFVGTAQPQGARCLWEVDTDGSGVIGTPRDMRLWLPRPQVLTLEFAGALSDPATPLFSKTNEQPHNHPVYLLPIDPIRAFINDDGTGAASGAHKFDVFASTDGAAEVTLFTSSGTSDQRPSIAYNEATLRDIDSWPEVMELAAYAQLRAKYVDDPGSISVWPTGARIHLLVVPAA